MEIDVLCRNETWTGEDRQTTTSSVEVGHLEVQQDDGQVTLQVLLLIDGEVDVASIDGCDDILRDVETTDEAITTP